MTTITLPPAFGYVLLTTALTTFNGVWHGLRVSSFRKAAGLGYPTPYADSAQIAQADSEAKKKALYIFNCAQRAHGNFLENQSGVLVTMLIAGLRFPLAATGFGLMWNVGRVVYAVGYTDKSKTNGKGRLQGSFFWLAQLGLLVLSGWTGAGIAGLV
ncbi:Hypothetical protein D9617_7g031500 [Elsinoe fawcettii]|nr:Hypothetical protein D9617_7g031500 [Elsinoe fawcettii]